ncbi:sensor histidine kinase, partial [Schumannella luteola]
MAESLMSGLAIVAAVALLAVAGFLVARRFARGQGELGTEAERARFTTLHLATRAAEHLRAGLEAGDTTRAARDLRAMLDCEGLAIAG